MSKKILSVKPTKNPRKFIFETEMPADELVQLVKKEFPWAFGNNVIASIKPTGLWKDKLFVSFANTIPCSWVRDFKTNLNEKIEVEAKKTVQEAADWVVEYMGSIKTTMHVKEATARYFACACAQNQFAYYDGARIETKNIKLIKNTKTGKQLWPRETEQKKTYCEVVVAHHTRSLFVTHEDADEIIGWMKRYHEKMCAGEPCSCCCTIHDQKGDVRTSVLLCDIKHIYDENGNDMLADGLAKAQKTADIWHVEVRRQAYIKDNKFDLPARNGLSLLDQLQSGIDVVTFHDVNGKAYRFISSSILCLWNKEKTLWSHEDKKPDTSFKAPSLLSRIYE